MIGRLRAGLAAWSGVRAGRFERAVAMPPLRSLGELVATSHAAFDRHLLSLDPQAFRLDGGQARAAIAAATTDGRRLADAYPAGADPRDIARSLGIAIEYPSGANKFGSVFQFADYTGRPPTIRIYMQAMELLRAAIARGGLRDRFADPVDLYIGHELYHHLDSRRADPVGRAVRVTTFVLGPLRLTSGLVSLSEIGACAFAAALTRSEGHPRLLDLLALRHVAPERAAQVEETLRGFAEGG